MSSVTGSSQNDPILEATDYAEFKKLLYESNCQKCPLHTGRTQIVVDRGNPLAKVMMIGEGPGANEDLEGKSFVGRSGKLLDVLLKEMGFDTNQHALIANIVKCRPPDNRQPTPDEATTCKPFLQKQIEIVKPKVILLLGATAFRHMIQGKKKFSMKREAGRFFQNPIYPGIDFMVIYHPAYILRDSRKKPLMVEHLKRFKEYWDEHIRVAS